MGRPGAPGLAAHTRWRTIRGVEARVVYFDGCPCWRRAADRLVQALMLIGRDEVRVGLVEVQSTADAATSGFAGSPTILIDGDDLFPGRPQRPELAAGELSCRLYSTSAGLAGVPHVDDLVSALIERNRS
jgi:hypothetical protein